MDEQIGMFDDLEHYTVSEDRKKSCCFTGHRNINPDKKLALLAKMKNTISYLYSKGVTDFHTGGALGFDTLAATQILDMRRDHPGMKLILNLPYKNQSERWSTANKRIYDFILSNADSISFAFEEEVKGAAQAKKYLLMRNRIMVNSSHYCIAYFSGNDASGTGYTVNYAQNAESEIINLF